MRWCEYLSLCILSVLLLIIDLGQCVETLNLKNDTRSIKELLPRTNSPNGKNTDDVIYLGCYSSLNSNLPYNYSVSLLKGVDCRCAELEGFKIERIQEKYCDYHCLNRKDKAGVNTTCGGNFAYSVSCVDDKNAPGRETCKNRNDTQSQDYETFVQPKLNFTETPNRTFECAAWKDNENFRNNAKDFNYSPNNSPESCARFCLSSKNRKFDSVKAKYALVGSNRFYEQQQSYCYCYSKETLEQWNAVSADKCTVVCPGNTKFKCGGTDDKFFTIYDIENPGVGIRSDESVSNTEYNTTVNSTTNRFTTTAMATTLEYISSTMSTKIDPPISTKTEIVPKDNWLIKIENHMNKIPKVVNNSVAQEYLTNITKNTKESKDDPVETYTGLEISRILDVVSTVVDRTGNGIEGLRNTTRLTVSIIQTLTTQPRQWNELKENGSETASKVLNTVENVAFKFVAELKNSNSTVNETSKDFGSVSELQVTAGFVEKNDLPNSLTYPSSRFPNQSYIELPKNWTQLFNSSVISYVGITLPAQSVKTVFGLNVEGNLTILKEKHINSDLVSLTLQGKNSTVKLKAHGVKITLKHIEPLHPDVSTNPLMRESPSHCQGPIYMAGRSSCVYWDINKGLWSPDGCKLLSSNESVSVCECNHLTAFALLVDVYNYVGTQPGLEIITLILCPIAILCLMLSILLMTKFSISFGARNVMTINLCSCLLLANLLVLFVMDRNYFCLSQTLCTISGAFIHYVMLCALCWMAMEGILLYRLIVTIFDRGNDYIIGQHLIGYGLPIVILGLNGLTGFLTNERPYGGNEFCYLNGNFIFSFFIPMAIVVLGNLTVLIRTLTVAYNRGKSTLTRNSKGISLIRCIRGSIFVSVLLGVTWIAGFIMLINDYTVSIIGAYIFTILNASQGIVIFAFHFKSNEKLWCIFRKKILSFISNIPFQKRDIETKTQSGNSDWQVRSRGTNEDSLDLEHY